jgi:nickel/cobalt transporter (NicO) family protein
MVSPIRSIKLLFVGMLAAALLCIAIESAAAHPLDRLNQHLLVDLRQDDVRLTLAIGGGMLANEMVLDELDPSGNRQLSQAEITAWRDQVLDRITITIDGESVVVDRARVDVLIPGLAEFHVGLRPIMLIIPVEVPSAGAPADRYLAVRNDYRVDWSDFQFAVAAGDGTSLLDAAWPSAITRVAYRVDPALSGTGESSTVTSAEAWGATGVIAKAERVFSQEKTPKLIFGMLGIFLVLGGLHALQPGHGKTLVAAYLVATGGTAVDALILAGIVTFTHTISVFLIGSATLVASEFFLPSRVIPVMEMLSGILVVGMGGFMLWRGLMRRRAGALAYGHHYHSHDHHHDYSHDHHHGHSHHHHDHANLSDEEHARLHLAEVEQVRRGVGLRGLAALGISGGMVPCPDALAILLLALGINQLAFGMVAIVAFSLGLAGVLISFGLAIALAGPFWTRARGAMEHQGAFSRRLSVGLTQVATASPMISAVVVLLLGLAMVGRATGAM